MIGCLLQVKQSLGLLRLFRQAQNHTAKAILFLLNTWPNTQGISVGKGHPTKVKPGVCTCSIMFFPLPKEP
jgi:hypothetical protein